MAVVESSIADEAAQDAGRRPESLAARLGRLVIDGPALGLLLPVAAAIGWEMAVRLGWSSGRLVPPPSVIWETFLQLAKGGALQHHAAATLTRVAIGFGAGVAAGTIAGAVTGYSRFLCRLLDPTLQALRAIPSIAWVPLFILWLGIFEASKVTLIAVGVFFPV
jgi:sulfonate transport system permease protein